MYVYVSVHLCIVIILLFYVLGYLNEVMNNDTIWRETFEGENFCGFRGLRTIREGFLCVQAR